MIIGLNGRLKSGKDTTYGIIKDFIPTAERVSFAAKLKESAAAAIGLDIETLEYLKGDENLYYILEDKSVLNDTYRFNVRQYLQWYGTEAHREIFGDNFWVDQALPVDLDHSDRLLVVTDVRFPNEAIRVLDLGGTLVKVEREVETSHSNHASEQNLDAWIDYPLDNRGTISELKLEVLEMLREFGLIEKEQHAYTG